MKTVQKFVLEFQVDKQTLKYPQIQAQIKTESMKLFAEMGYMIDSTWKLKVLSPKEVSDRTDVAEDKVIARMTIEGIPWQPPGSGRK